MRRFATGYEERCRKKEYRKKFVHLRTGQKALVEDKEFLLGVERLADNLEGVLARGEGLCLELEVRLLFAGEFACGDGEHALARFVHDFNLHELRVTHGQVEVAVQVHDVDVHLRERVTAVHRFAAHGAGVVVVPDVERGRRVLARISRLDKRLAGFDCSENDCV